MRTKINFDKGIGIIIASVFCFFAFYTIGDYGILRHSEYMYPRGEAFVNYFFSGSKDYSNIPQNEQCFFQKDTFMQIVSDNYDTKPFGQDISSNLGTVDPTPPMGSIVSALGCYIFNRKLGLLNVTDAHNSMFVIMGALTILLVYLLALEAYGLKVATLSAIFLALFPRFVGHAYNNYRDFPILFFCSVAIWAFWKGTKKKDWKWIILSSIFWGLGMLTKPNALFVSATIVPWLVFLIWKTKGFLSDTRKSFWIATICYPLVAALVFFLLWPYLWYDTLAHITNFYNLYKATASTNKWIGVIKWRPYYAPLYTFITTPEPIIFLGIIGIFTAFKNLKNEHDKISLLLLLWLCAPILMFTIPKTLVRSGIRHFMHYIPALCILSGLGAERFYYFMVERLKRFKRNIAVPVSLGVQLVFIGWLLFSVVETHPYQTLYFNSLMGGLYGANTVKIPFLPNRGGLPGATDYWGNPYNSPQMTGIPDAHDILLTSYRRAFSWLNKNAESNSLLIVYNGVLREEGSGVIGMVGCSPELRKDFKTQELRYLHNVEEIDKTLHNHCYIMFVPDTKILTRWNPVVQYCYKNLKPVYSEEIQGAPVFLIYKFT